MSTASMSSMSLKSVSGEQLTLRCITVQCSWCLEWIRAVDGDARSATIAVSHGLCSCCVERLMSSEAKSEASFEVSKASRGLESER